MRSFFRKNNQLLIYLLPTIWICGYLFYRSLNFGVHDFGNSYFAAKMVQDEDVPLTDLYDITAFNSYVWGLGHDEIVLDFYLNSPFTSVAFYPLGSIANAFWGKVIFNIISLFVFLLTLFYLCKDYVRTNTWLLLTIPIVFFVPIRNHILFGQSYFLILGLMFFAFRALERKKSGWAASLLSLAILTKFFPIFYGIIWFIQKRWKAIAYGVGCCLLLVGLGVLLTGADLWKFYFFEALPQAIESKTTIDFRTNYQSMDVFLKQLFIKDTYYNPSAIFDNEKMYVFLLWVFKTLVLGAGIHILMLYRQKLLESLAILVVVLFLLQSRTATYAQILWVIPLAVVWNSRLNKKLKLVFLFLLFLIANVPLGKLAPFPIGVQFLRLWLFIVAGLLFYYSFSRKLPSWKPIVFAFVLLLPLHLNAIRGSEDDQSVYVLPKKTHFMITDFGVERENLWYSVLGRDGIDTIHTSIPIRSFDSDEVILRDNELYIAEERIVLPPSLKKNPILINDCELYFLTDHRSRRGAFTLKKVTICNTLQ